jgi:hypothetical protein
MPPGSAIVPMASYGLLKGIEMNTAKHSPGPWKVVRCSDLMIGVQDANGFGVANASAPSNRDTTKIAANARLIAAAPELLAALESLVDACRNGLPGRERACHPARTLAYRAAREAIAKANACQRD